MVWQAVIPAVAEFASGLFKRNENQVSAATQYRNQSKLNKQGYKYSLKLQNHQNAFSEHMFDRSVDLVNSAHQRQVEDMRKAGLNPILSATGGNGAQGVSPIAGGSASLSGGQAGMPGSADIDLLGAYSTANQVKNDKARVHNETLNSASQRDLNQSQGMKLNADRESTIAQTEINKTQSAKDLQLKDMQMKKIKNEITNNNRMTDATIRKYAAETDNYKSNSAKNYDDIRNRPITNSESVSLGPVKLGYTSTKQGSSRASGSAINKKNPITNPSYGSYR